MLMYVLLVVGFVLLIKGADFFVDGAGAVAKLLRIPSVVIGLTIVAMGTSAPEAAVSIAAGFAGNSDISLSNVLGSNIFNLLVVIGVCAVIFPITVGKEILHRDLWWSIGAAAATLLFMLDSQIGRLEGVLLLCAFISYLVVVVRSALKNRIEGEPQKSLSPIKSVLYICIGLAAVIIGGDLVVDNASAIAKSLGVSDTLIGLTIVAMGTSLPELVTSIVAAKKGDSSLALGNVIGSNIFNLLFILGTASSIVPIAVNMQLIADVAYLIGISLLLFVFCFKNKRFSLPCGIVYLLLYAAYTAFIILR